MTEHLSGGKDWSTPMPMTGKAKRKRIYNWITCEYEEVTVIELGCRELPPGMSYAQRLALRSPKARDEAPEPERRKKMEAPAPDSQRARIHAYIRKHGPSTAGELAQHLKTTRENIAAQLHKDGLLRQVKSRMNPHATRKRELVRWALIEGEVADDDE